MRGTETQKVPTPEHTEAQDDQTSFKAEVRSKETALRHFLRKHVSRAADVERVADARRPRMTG